MDKQAKAKAERTWSDAVASAYHRILEGGGEKTRLAADMEVSVHTLERGLRTGHWSRATVIRMAVATKQDPVRMLARESIP